jgi:hypothetical protein
MPRGALKAGVDVTATGFRGHPPNGLVMANVGIDVPPAKLKPVDGPQIWDPSGVSASDEMFSAVVLLTWAVPLTGGICTNFVEPLVGPHAAKTEPSDGATVTALQYSLPVVE